MTSNLHLSALVLVLLGTANAAIHVDTETDLLNQPNFSSSCFLGYHDHPSDFKCKGVGGIHVPSEDLNAGQVGFWTQCEDLVHSCFLSYYVLPGDASFAARFYLRNLPALIFIDGKSDIIHGNGWVDFNMPISNVTRTIVVGMDHFDTNIFSLLDRVAVNAELPPLVPGPPSNSTGRIM